MAPSQEEKSHTNGAQEISKSVNRWNLCLPTVSRSFFPDRLCCELKFRTQLAHRVVPQSVTVRIQRSTADT
jgi:hypothetical protein